MLCIKSLNSNTKGQHKDKTTRSYPGDHRFVVVFLFVELDTRLYVYSSRQNPEELDTGRTCDPVSLAVWRYLYYPIKPRLVIHTLGSENNTFLPNSLTVFIS